MFGTPERDDGRGERCNGKFVALGHVPPLLELPPYSYHAHPKLRPLAHPGRVRRCKRVSALRVSEVAATAAIPQVGAGDELIPSPNEPSDLRDTVRNPDRTSALASAERLKLAADTHSLELAVDLADTIGARDSIEKELAHQMAVTHRLGMRIAERVTRELNNIPPDRLPQNSTLEITRLINAQCRLFETYQSSALTLAKKRNPNRQTIVVRQQILADAGAQVAVAGTVTSGKGVTSNGE